MQLQAPGGSGGVDALVQADERDTQSGQFIQREYQVAQVAAETVEAPNDEGVEPTMTGIGKKAVEGRHHKANGTKGSRKNNSDK